MEIQSQKDRTVSNCVSRASLKKGNLDREGKTKQKSEIFSPYFPPLYAQPIIGFSL